MDRSDASFSNFKRGAIRERFFFADSGEKKSVNDFYPPTVAGDNP
jgi:hypothetical protein